MVHSDGMTSCLLVFVAVLAIQAAASAAEARQGADDWLNARDCGASGSKFETPATTTAGSNRVAVKDIGDFKVGQGAMVSRCNIHYTEAQLWGPKTKRVAPRPIKGELEFRGYDGSKGSWTVYVLDVAPAAQPAFRWTDDLGRTWSANVPIDKEWHKLSGGLEVRFGDLDWPSGYVVTFGARDQLVSRIEKVEGNVLTLKDAANRSATDAVVRHCDDAALQDAVDRAIKEKRHLFVPPGCYRLARGVTVQDPAGTIIEGANAVDTVLDITEGNGSCISLKGGTEVTLRNLRFV
ncbi:MAG: hypothetical protein FJ278_09435, partial [Planctomycetes bacterium]|nr:hypothetical protein [Planctomycetota bacterium]